MDTIKNYLEGMFTGLGQSPEIIKAKEELLSMMEDKYHQLINQGATENAAVGQVIAEFGNLSELAEVLGINDQVENKSDVTVIDSQTAMNMFEDYNKVIPRIAWGVLVILLGVSIFLTLLGLSEVSQLNLNQETMTGVGLFVLITLVAFAVYLFIMSSQPLQPYEHFKKEVLHLESLTKKMVEDKVKEANKNYYQTIALSVILFILSAIPLMISALVENNIIIYLSTAILFVVIVLLRQVKMMVIYVPAVVLMLIIVTLYGYNPLFSLVFSVLMVSLGVFSLIEQSATNQVGNILLQKEQYSVQSKKDTLSETVSGVYWIIIVGIYLFWSFTTHNWHITWVVWPIAGLLFALITQTIKYKQSKQ